MTLFPGGSGLLRDIIARYCHKNEEQHRQDNEYDF